MPGVKSVPFYQLDRVVELYKEQVRTMSAILGFTATQLFRAAYTTTPTQMRERVLELAVMVEAAKP